MWNAKWQSATCLFGLALQRGERHQKHIPFFPPQSPFPLRHSSSFPCTSSSFVEDELHFFVGDTDVIGLLSLAFAAGPWSHIKELNCNKSFHGQRARIVEPVPHGVGRGKLTTNFYCQGEGGRRADRIHPQTVAVNSLSGSSLQRNLFPKLHLHPLSVPYRLANNGSLIVFACMSTIPLNVSLSQVSYGTKHCTKPPHAHLNESAFKEAFHPFLDALALQLQCQPLFLFLQSPTTLSEMKPRAGLLKDPTSSLLHNPISVP